jgi:kinesin family protein C2/C3
MSAASQDVAEHLEIRFEEMPPAVEATATGTTVDKKADGKETPLLQVTENVVETAEPSPQVLLSFPASKSASKIHNTLDITAVKEREQAKKQQAEETGTIVSSLTGAGFDQEIVEELHNALTELRAELEASRAEAARAVKVAEQAIQSAENSSSRDWSSTVTHKAAEAAALAQKRSAEAMSKMRLAEERLAVEKKNAGFWRKQAEAAEEEAGVLQTRIAAAEVQRAAMKEELDVERHKQVAVVASLKGRIESTESNQRDNLKAALAKNRSLEVELEGLQRELQARSKSSSIQEAGLPSMQQLFKVESETKALSKWLKVPLCLLWLVLLLINLTRIFSYRANTGQQFQLLQKSAMDEIKKLPALAQGWAKQMSDALASSRQEIGRLRSRLAAENATRRKLLHEVQDQRGVVRVYCRPRPLQSNSEASIGFLSFPSQETLLLRRSNIPWCQESSPLSFEFDRIFDSDVQQAEVYTEVEELLLGVLDGYNICVMAYGQTGCGKTYSLLGSVATSFDDETGEALVRLGNHGLQLTSMRQLFAVSGHRRDRYEDSFSLTIVEVRDERLCDLVAGTEMGETRGQVDFDDNSSRRSREQRHANSDDGSSFSKPLADTSTSSKGKLSKLEIRTNHDGDTVVQGLVSVTVNSFDDVIRVWQESLAQRAIRLSEQGVNPEKYEATSSVIATLKVISTNVATGIASVGKIQFVDLAGADLEPYEADDGKQQSQAPDTLVAGIADGEQWKLVNKSLTTLSEVASARCQFMRSVPYRNSTLTHLLRDSLEHDTKVLMLLCVSSDVEDARETTCALRMASRMRRINIGKATKHTLSHS